MTEETRSAGATTAGLVHLQDWAAFFAGFSHLVLVANSEEQDYRALRARYPQTALFIFFNRVNRVLDAPIGDNALLVTRSNQAGSELVYRGILGEMTQLLQPPGFRGVMNIRVVGFERLMDAADFGTTPAGVLDLAPYFEGLYPRDHTASSGFALALWLCEQVPDAKVVLSGFSARRGSKWKIFQVHDWVFEQTILTLLATTGRLEIFGGAANPYATVAQRFPGIAREDLLLAALHVISQQLENGRRQIDELISVTAPFRAAYGWFRSLKGKSTKQKVLEANARRDRDQPAADERSNPPS